MANVPISNLTTTWNNVATTFTGIKLNVTDTASAAGSLLADFQVGGVSKFKVDKTGQTEVNGYVIGDPSYGIRRTTNVPAVITGGSNGASSIDLAGTFVLLNAITFSRGSQDLKLVYDASQTLAQRNGVNAQTHRTYGTYTDGSNYRRLTQTMSAAGVAEIKPEGAGTGATGNVLHISGLPTSNPGPGILWNNLGVVSVGT